MPLPPAISPFWQTDGGKFAAYAQRANGRTNGQGECGEEGLRERLAGRQFRKTFGQIQIQFARGGEWGEAHNVTVRACVPVDRQLTLPSPTKRGVSVCVCACVCARNVVQMAAVTV